MAELRLEDRYEKKRNHIFWFSGAATLLAVSLFDNPNQRQIDVFKSGIIIDFDHIGFFLLVILTYQAVSFWFEDRKVALLNSELAKRGDFADAKEAIQKEADALISDARARVASILEQLDDEQIEVISASLQEILIELQSFDTHLLQQHEMIERHPGRLESEPGRSPEPTRAQLGIDNIRTKLEEHLSKIRSADLTNLAKVERTLADAKLANERLEKAASGIRSELASLLSNLYAIRGDLSRMDRLQLLVLERYVPYAALAVGWVSSAWLAVRDSLAHLARSAT